MIPEITDPFAASQGGAPDPFATRSVCRSPRWPTDYGTVHRGTCPDRHQTPRLPIRPVTDPFAAAPPEVADCLCTPFRSASFDAAISIAVSSVPSLASVGLIGGVPRAMGEWTEREVIGNGLGLVSSWSGS